MFVQLVEKGFNAHATGRAARVSILSRVSVLLLWCVYKLSDLEMFYVRHDDMYYCCMLSPSQVPKRHVQYFEGKALQINTCLPSPLPRSVSVSCLYLCVIVSVCHQAHMSIQF